MKDFQCPNLWYLVVLGCWTKFCIRRLVITAPLLVGMHAYSLWQNRISVAGLSVCLVGRFLRCLTNQNFTPYFKWAIIWFHLWNLLHSFWQRQNGWQTPSAVGSMWITFHFPKLKLLCIWWVEYRLLLPHHITNWGYLTPNKMRWATRRRRRRRRDLCSNGIYGDYRLLS